jgi:autotransporter-associated beta strand protein
MGGNATGIGSLVINGGTFATTTATTAAGMVLGNAGYGGIILNGGSFTTRRVDLSTSVATSAIGVMQVNGGAFNASEYILMRDYRADFTVTNGQVNHAGASNNIAIAYQGDATTFTAMTVAGGLVDNTGKNVTFGETGTATSALGSGALNLNGGTMRTNQIQTYNATSKATKAVVNFNGGTLQAAAATTDLIGFNGTGGTSTMSLVVNGAFGTFPGGAVIDSNSFNVTLAQPLVAPTGNGVTNLTLNTQGSGYIGAPYVEISGGGGTGATGYAVVDTDPSSGTYGRVTSIVLTNPGTGYTSTPTVTLLGGGGTGAGVAATGISANTSGGLTKTGAGTLTLTAANTFTGATTVNGGTLSISPNALPATSSLVVGNTGSGTFDLYQDNAGVAWNMAANANLTLGSATASGSLGFQLGTASDRIVLSGTGGLTVNAGGGFINVVGLTGFGAGNSYDVITGASSITGFSNLQLGSLPTGFQYGLVNGGNKVTLTVAQVAAGNFYWTGDRSTSWTPISGGNSNWSTTQNGLTDPGYTPGSANVVHFSADGVTTPITTTLDAPFSIQGLKFLSSPTSSVTVAPGTGGTLTLGTSGIEVQAGGPVTTTISAPVNLSGAQTWKVTDSGSTLTIGGIISGGATMSSAASPGQNVGLTISGGGAVEFTNTGNTFTGDILVDGGTFVVNNDRDWGAPTTTGSTSHSIILNNGGKLNVTASLNPTSSTGGTIYNLIGIAAGGGTVDQIAGVTLQLDDPGQLYGIGTLTKTGLGTLVLRSQPTTFTGAIDITAGTLKMSGTSGGFGTNTLGTTIRSGAALDMAGQTGTDTEPLTIYGTGLAALPAGVVTNSSTTSATFAGPITLGSDASVGTATSGSLTLSGGVSGAFTLTNAGASTGGLTISGVIGANVAGIVQNSTNSALTLGGVANLWTGGLTIKAGVVNGGANANTFGGNTNVITLGDSSGSANATLSATSSQTYPQPISVASGNTGTATIIAGTSTGNVVFSGPITLNSHGVTLAKTGTAGASQFTGGITGTGDVTVQNNATTSAGTITLAGGTINHTGLITNAGTGTGATTISANIGSNVTGVTQNSATSQLTLSGVNSFSGPLTVSAGTLLLTRPLALYTNLPGNWTTTNIVVNSGATLALNVGGFGEFTSDNIATLTALGAATGGFMDGSTLAIDTTNAGGNFTVAGSIASPNGGANAVNLTKIGTGTLTLAASNTYTGRTTITSGALAGGLGSGNLVLNGGVYENSGTFTRSLGTGDGQVQWTAGANGGFSARGGAFTVTLGGTSPVVWDSTPNFVSGAGQLLFGSGTADDAVTLTNNVNLNDPGTAVTRTVQVLDNTAATTDKAVLSGIISGGTNATFAKTGAGVLELSGANTYSGPTTNTTGTLILSGSNSSSGTTTLTSGTLMLNSASNGGLASGQLILTSGTLQAANAARSISNNVLLTAVTVSGTQDLTINGTVTGAAGGSRTLTTSITGGTLMLSNVAINTDNTVARTLTLAGTGATVVNGVISNGNGDTFANALTLSSTGTTTLNGANTYTGTTTVSAGTVIIGNNQAFGLGTALTISGGTLQGDGTGTRTLSQNVTHSTGTVTIGGADKLVFNGTWLTSGGTRTLTVNSAGGAELNGMVTLGEGTANRTEVFSGSGNILVSGVIRSNPDTTAAAALTASTASLSYTGSGTLTLTGANTYGGLTTINNNLGTVTLSGAGGLSSGNLTVNAGTLNLNPTLDQSVALLTMGGGAAGSTSNISIPTGRKLTVTGVSYLATNNPMTATISGAGTLDLGTAGITVDVANSTAVDVDMSWAMNTVTGSGAFVKAGAGTLDIRGVTNYNYAATSYQINAGAILGLDASTTNLVLNGGVFEGNGTFTRSLGTGNNQVQWLSGGGGFSARGGALTVTLASAPDPLVWGSTTNFVPAGAPLIFGSTTADSVVTFTHNIDLNAASQTVQVVDNTAVTTDKAVLSGVLSNGGLSKTGNGTLTLGGANTFTGAIAVNQGTLEFSTASDNSSITASNLGLGTDGITIGTSTASATLSFIGNAVSQSTNRAISLTGNSTLAANGTNNAAITYAGAITAGTDFSLTLAGTGSGTISGGFTQPAGAASADLVVTGGNWTLTGANTTIADDVLVNGGTLTISNTVVTSNDDVVVTGPTAILNLNSTGVLMAANPAGTSNGLYTRGGSVISLNANDVNGVNNAAGIDIIGVGEATTTGIGTFNTNTFNITTPRIDVGAIADNLTGIVLGTGTITSNYAVNDYGQGFRFFRGSVATNLAGISPILKQGLWDFTLSGDNSGLSGTVAGLRLDSGNLILDYSTDNHTKLNAGVSLDMRGGTLTLKGGVLADTVQNVASFTLANGGANTISVGSTGTFATTLNLNAITRANNAGTVRFVKGTAGTIKTSTGNNATSGLLGSTGTAFATIDDGSGTYFAINDGLGNIVPLTYAAPKNDVSTWTTTDNVTSGGAGFTGTIGRSSINSLRFNATTPSTLTIAPTGLLNITSGGLLQTSNVTGGPTIITGGHLVAGLGELVITTDSADSNLRISSYMSGTMGLTKTGDGTLILDSTAHYSGATNLQNGVLQISGGNAIGDRSLVTLADDHANTLRLLDDETIGGLQGGSGTTGLSTLALVDFGTHNLTINQTATATYSGLFSGTGQIIKMGTSTLTLAGTSSYAGDLIVNQGQLTLGSRTVANFSSLGSLTLNAGTVVLDFAGGDESAPNKIRDAAPVTLINTGGIDGLRANSDRTALSKTETVGAVTFLGGANTVTVSESGTITSGGAQRAMTITAASLARSNRSTLLVRGTNLGTTLPGTSADWLHTGRFVSTAAPTLSGAAGGVGSTTISILPWAVGGTSTTDVGSSFVTYASGTGFRPLDPTTEYEQLTAAGGVTLNNNVRLSSGTDLTLDNSSATRTMNSLLVGNTNTTATTITLAGAGASLNVNSGAFLFMGTQGITLNGFSGITTGTTNNEYVLHVANTATAGVTISSPFTTSGAALTKSGAGALILTATGSTYTGPTTINQGALQIDSLNKLGNFGSGGVMLNGGTLRFGGSFDLSAVPITFGVPATDPVVTTTGGTLDTNGSNVTLASSIGNGGNGGFTKAGAGILTLNARANYGGATSITGGTLAYGVANALPMTTDLTLGAGTLAVGANAATLDALTVTGAGSITGSAPVTFAGDVTNSGGSNTLTINNSAATTFNGRYVLLSESTTARTMTMSVTGTGAVTVNSSVTDGPAAASNFTKSGSGTLELTGANTYSGTTTNTTGTLILSGSNDSAGATILTAGTLQLNSPTNGGLASGTLTLTAGNLQALNAARSFSNNVLLTAVTAIGTQNLSMTGTLTGVTGASHTLTNNISSGTLTLGNVNITNETTTTARSLTIAGSGNTVISGGIANGPSTIAAESLIFSGSGTLELTGANTYTGSTTTSTGTLILSGSNDSAGGTTLTSGTLQLNSASNGGLASGTLTLTTGNIQALNTARSISNNVLLTAVNVIGTQDLTLTGTLTGATGASRTLTNNLTAGTLRVGNVNITNETTTTARTLIFGGSGNTIVNGVIANGTGTVVGENVTVLGTGSGVTTFATANSYTGSTSINSGTLKLTADQAMTGALNFGSAAGTTTVGTLDLTSASASFGSILAQTDSTSASQVLIGDGESLSTNGTVTIGSSSGANTRLSVSGEGTFTMTNPTTGTSGTTFVVGGTGTSNLSVADFSGLRKMDVTLGGTMQVGGTNTGGGTGYGTLKLAINSTITAATLGVGNGSTNGGNAGQVNSIILGTGTNVFNVDNFLVGAGPRDFGSVSFDSPTGTIKIRTSADPVNGRAAFGLGSGSGTTGTASVGNQNTFDVTGHQADLRLATVSIGTQNRGSELTNVFSFDQGTLDMTSLSMSTRSADSTNGTNPAQPRTTSSTVNLGGGTVAIQSGILNMASAAGTYTTNAAPIMSATINISGGAVTIGATSGTAIKMAAYTATGGTGTGSATALLNLTGGTTTVNGNILRVTTAANTTATVKLSGTNAILDMANHNIGDANTIALILEAGTLKNVAQINNGADITKATSGVLTMSGQSTYTGQTNITEGTLLIGSSTTGTLSISSGSGPVGRGTLSLSNGVSIAGTPNAGGWSIANNVTIGGALTFAGLDALQNLILNGVTTLADGDHDITVTDADVTATLAGKVTGNANLTKSGAGTLVLSSTDDDYTGTTTINAGTLALGAGDVIPNSSPLVIGGSGTLDMAGHNETVPSLSGSGGVRSSGGAPTTLTVDDAPASNTEFSGKITNAVKIVKKGTGTLALTSADSDFSGGVTIQAGTLTIGANSTATLSPTSGSGPLGRGTLTLEDGVTIQGKTGGQWTVANAVVLNGNVTFGGTTADQSLVLTGTVDLGAITRTLTVNPTITATLNGVISGQGGLTKGGAGTLVLGGANTYAGGTTISTGTLQLGANDVLPDGTGKGGVTADGALDLAGHSDTINALLGTGIVDNSTASTASTLTVGTTDLSSSFSGTIRNSGTNAVLSLVKVGTGTLTLSGNNTFSGGVTITAGTVSVSANENLGDNAGGVTFGAASTLAVTGTLATTRALNLNSAATVDVAASQTATFSGKLSGTGSLTKTGDGVMALANSNTAAPDRNSYTGGTTLAAGTLAVSLDQQLGDDSGSLTFGGTSTLRTTGTTFASARNVSINTGATGTVEVTGTSTTLSGSISGSGILRKTGGGELVLSNSGDNSYSGGTLIDSGTLSVAKATHLGSGGVTFTGAGTLKATDDFAINRSFTLGATSTFEVASGKTLTMGATSDLHGAGTFVKAGTGTLVVSSNNSAQFTGSTTISAGTFVAANSAGSATGDGNVTVGSAGTLTGGGFITGSVAVAGTLAPTAALATGPLSLQNGSTYSLHLDTSALTGDHVNVTGGFSIDGAVILSLQDGGAATTLNVGDRIALASYTGAWNGGKFIVPGFGEIADWVDNDNPSYFFLNGNPVGIDYNFDPDTNNASNPLEVSLVVVPEPGSLASLAGSAGLLLGLQRFRRRSKQS